MKKILLFSFGLLFACIFIPGCKKVTTIKEVNNPDIKLYGVWKIISPGEYPTIKYVSFSTSKVSNVYMASVVGFHSVVTATFQPYSDQVLAVLDNSLQNRVYNYHFNGDTLVLERGASLAFTAIKASDNDVSSWVTEVSSSDEINGVISDKPYGMGFDGSNLLVPDYYSGDITKISLATRLPSGTVHVNGVSPYSVEFDGTDIWCSDDGGSYIYRYAITGGAILSTSPKLGPWIYGIAYDPTGAQIWAYANNADSMYMFAKTGTTVLATHFVPNGPTDLAWSNGKLYITENNNIHRVNPSSFTVEKTYKLKSGAAIYGIAAVGSDFWLNIEGNKLTKVTLN